MNGIFRYFTTEITERVSCRVTGLRRSLMSRYVIDVGKILAGIQVPPDESKEFDEFLEQLGYEYVEETNNDTYKRYLQSA